MSTTAGSYKEKEFIRISEVVLVSLPPILAFLL